MPVIRWTLLSAIALVPSAAYAQNSSAMTADAREVIAARMIDPSSLTIRNFEKKSATATDGRTVAIFCGEYNAKNRFGGYAGFKAFVYEPEVMKGVLAFDGNMKLDFMSTDGSSDVSHDPDAAIRAGVDPAKLSARYRKATNFAIQYLPVCLGAS